MTSNDPPNSVYPQTRAEWRAWLEQNHTRTAGVWLISYKRSTGQPYVEYEDAVEEALCFGWIDGQAKKLDEMRSIQWFAPRRAGSGWAQTNKARVERLIAAGLMTPVGLAKIESARQDGSWSRLDAAIALQVPLDLQAALDANPAAAQYFAAFPPSAKRMLLEWIYTAKRPETRARRVAETVRQAAENRRAYPPPR